ncbi:MAG: hypothetical protein KF716_31945 [Anaerolineae bacterium]|nr:hypothetical protein [Anaerolineae bacterium]
MGNDLGWLALLSGGSALFLLYLLVKIGRGLLIGTRVAIPQVAIVARDQAPPAPSPDLEGQLLAFGFRPIGVTLYQSSLLHGYTWHYADETNEIDVEMVAAHSKQAEAFLCFNTWFQDQAFLWTGYPTGENIQTADLHMWYASQSLETAYLYHCRQLAVWRRTHGDAVKRPDLSDNDYYDRLYNEKYRARHLRAPMRRGLLTALVLLLMALTNLAVLAEALRLQPIYAAAFAPMPGGIKINIPEGFVSASLPYLLQWVVGVAALNRLSAWKAPSLEDSGERSG